jgi:acyl-CoA reductase-like NAD-dependent aldehyde dehydrogenase
MTALKTNTDLPRYQHVIDGRRVEAASGQRYDSVDPYLGMAWASAADGDAADVDLAVAAARRALGGPWGQLTGFGRAALMRRLGDLIARDADRLAVIETRDTGKLLREMRGQLATIPQWFSYFSGLADKLEGTTIPGDKPNFLVYTRREPAGVVGAIVPWNSPLLLLCWKLAPALAAGCTMVAKPSDYSPASAVELAALMDEAGFPPGVFNVVTGFGPAVGKALAAHPDVDKIAFTGSTAVGAQVAAAAAANITGVLLELGGKSAHLVFDDADLDAACNGILAGVFAATGQTCMAGSRLLVARSVHDALVDKIAERARSIRLGDPKAADTEMGPVATEPQYRKVLSFLEGAAGEGATVTAGGRPDDALGGFFVQPTVLTGVKPTMTVACEEVFGPILSVIPFDTEEEAIALANDSRYGLAGAVWTKDIHRGHRVAHAMRTGTVWINAYRVVGPDVPFGGYGLSGLGRENGIEAVHEYTVTKAIWVELTGGTRHRRALPGDEGQGRRGRHAAGPARRGHPGRARQPGLRGAAQLRGPGRVRAVRAIRRLGRVRGAHGQPAL